MNIPVEVGEGSFTKIPVIFTKGIEGGKYLRIQPRHEIQCLRLDMV